MFKENLVAQFIMQWLYFVALIVGAKSSPTSSAIELNIPTTSGYDIVIEEVTSSGPRLSRQDLYLQSFDLGNISEECVFQLKKADDCLSDLMFVNQETVMVPKNLQEIDDYCG